MKRAVKYIAVLALLLAVAAVVSAQYPIVPGIQEQEEERRALSLVAAYTDTEHRQMLLELTRRYEEAQQQLSVEVEFIPQEDHMKRLLLRYLQEQPPDMIILGNNNIRYLAQDHFLCDLTGYMEELETLEQNAGRFYPVLLNSGEISKRYYAVPFTCSAFALFINESILSTHGIASPRTWMDIEVASRRISVYGPKGFAIAAREAEELVDQFLALYFTAGGTLNQIDGEEGMQAFELIERLSRSDILTLDSINWDQRDLTMQFNNQELVMMLNSSNQIPAIRKNAEDFTWSVRAVPAFDKTPSIARNSISAQSIAVTNADHLEEAMDFIRFASRPEQQIQTALAFGGIPVRERLWGYCLKDERNVGRLFYQQPDFTATIGPYRLWPSMAQSFHNGVFDLLSRTASSEEVAAQIQAEVREYRFSN